MSKLTGKTFSCQTCKKEYYRSGWQIKRGHTRFCSMSCRRFSPEAKTKMSIKKRGLPAWNKGIACTYKDKVSRGLVKLWKNTKYREAMIEAHLRSVKCKGENHPNWRGGITSEVIKIRNSREMKEWRIKVFERDNYTCQICGQVGGSLHADHIKPFCAFPELRLDVNNGRTLCVECHKQTDTYLSKAKASLAFAVPA